MSEFPWDIAFMLFVLMCFVTYVIVTILLMDD